MGVVKPDARCRRKLLGVHSDLVLVVSRAMLYTEVDFTVTEGLRSYARQVKLRATGKSQTLRSKHLKRNGFAHAVDVMAVGDLNDDGVTDHQDKSITWNRVHYWCIAAAMKRAAAELGIHIRWGGHFKSFFDGPHFELL